MFLIADVADIPWGALDAALSDDRFRRLKPRQSASTAFDAPCRWTRDTRVKKLSSKLLHKFNKSIEWPEGMEIEIQIMPAPLGYHNIETPRIGPQHLFGLLQRRNIGTCTSTAKDLILGPNYLHNRPRVFVWQRRGSGGLVEWVEDAAVGDRDVCRVESCPAEWVDVPCGGNQGSCRAERAGHDCEGGGEDEAVEWGVGALDDGIKN
ncbi:hypothetical protein FB45DRAFT_1009685 [Roridomyces roridus]|uniref:Uncharacterized protein n=1 Tax=Roridomyces roridus TaxID=1738132 RepID=A0AAD7F9X5_9AGAR|nr:hypothetical protein FB45DRAFT_1009685 [Roridomyces roridus]